MCDPVNFMCMAGMSQLEQLVFTVLPKGGFQFTPSIIIHKCAKIGMQHRESSFEIQCEKSRILTVVFHPSNSPYFGEYSRS